MAKLIQLACSEQNDFLNSGCNVSDVCDIVVTSRRQMVILSILIYLQTSLWKE
jgi:hypothetical protein